MKNKGLWFGIGAALVVILVVVGVAQYKGGFFKGALTDPCAGNPDLYVTGVGLKRSLTSYNNPSSVQFDGSIIVGNGGANVPANKPDIEVAFFNYTPEVKPNAEKVETFPVRAGALPKCNQTVKFATHPKFSTNQYVYPAHVRLDWQNTLHEANENNNKYGAISMYVKTQLEASGLNAPFNQSTLGWNALSFAPGYTYRLWAYSGEGKVAPLQDPAHAGFKQVIKDGNFEV